MEEKVKVGMATVEARMDDAGFIYSAWSGLRKVRENFRIKASIVESKGDEDLRAHLDFLSNEGYKIVWAVGYNAETPLMEAAARYPHIHFLGLDVHYEQIPQNVTTVEFREQEGAFLAGYTAARISKSGKIGFIGGSDVPLIRRFRYGYAEGATHAAKPAEVEARFADSFISFRRGRELAEELIAAGCDVLFHAAGAVGKGMIRAAKENDTKVIGVDIDQSFLAPEIVVTSLLKDGKKAVYNTTGSILKGETISKGENVVYGLKEGLISFSPLQNIENPDEIEDELNELRNRIVAGEIVPPVEA